MGQVLTESEVLINSLIRNSLRDDLNGIME